MILSLKINNIALIRELELKLTEGLNILSGETGAGKSIIIDSLSFVLGDRADKGLIRHGEKRATVEIVFSDDDNPRVNSALENAGLEKDEVIIVRRVMSDNGKSECRINGTAVTLGTLRKTVETLVDVHSQHEHQALLNENNHINILDGYCKGVTETLADYKKSYDNFLRLIQEAESFSDTDERVRRIDILRYQITEIERIALKEGEEESLLYLRDKYRNARKLAESVSAAAAYLEGDENIGAMAAVQAALREIQGVSRYDSALIGLADRLESVKIELSDVADSLSSELESLEFNPAEADRIEFRLEEIRNLKRRYGNSVCEIDNFLSDAENELQKLENAEERLCKLDKLIEKERADVLIKAKKLHTQRESGAKKFELAVLKNLSELGMQSSSFKVDINFPESDDAIISSLSANGADRVKFLISPNKGEPLKPLVKIASGGEMSRFMLGLKNITAELEGIDTLVFDEIDTGISGKIAMVVAEKLYDTSIKRQVIAVTHLPQLASMADSHYLIEKSECDNKTVTDVKLLSEEESVAEIMRLSGSRIGSEIGLLNAKEMKNASNDYKLTKIKE